MPTCTPMFNKWARKQNHGSMWDVTCFARLRDLKMGFPTIGGRQHLGEIARLLSCAWVHGLENCKTKRPLATTIVGGGHRVRRIANIMVLLRRCPATFASPISTYVVLSGVQLVMLHSVRLFDPRLTCIKLNQSHARCGPTIVGGRVFWNFVVGVSVPITIISFPIAPQTIFCGIGIG